MQCNTPASFAALLFDMDGLMIDTESLSARAWQQAASALDIPLQQRHIDAMVGLAMPLCLRYLITELGDETQARELEAQSRRQYHQALHQQEIPLKPGITELLDWCHHLDIARAVGTATQRQLADIKLARTGLARYFEHTIAGDEVARTKPAPDVYLQAASRLGVAPEYCIVLEDSAYGAQAALAANMRVIIVPDMQQPPADIAKQALAVCQDLFEARKLLESLLSLPR
ncbi:HAD family phosphatase [Vogesella sp. LIG4]|uniref:HAD family hydrolase n=1 Tax=Vogesella sp. LIG4 TaxID=1192162 RepID=UPI00081F922A|nr:HAD family phosphatase [Vogesella sp. LIG4]SCK25181.1 haloacid dehalogenase superfamily, subfamily IA, variant 3 with third motif having DD or ED [Vogesella sp. LIG4]